MAKRYLGGGISFEQQDVYQEFSEDDTPSPGGSSTLAGLTDVDISNPTDGQTLVYDATSGKWVNGESAGGGALIVHQDGEGVLDTTWQDISDASLAQTVLLIERRVFGEGQYVDFISALNMCGYAPPDEGLDPVYVAVFEDTTYISDTASGNPARAR